jgi:transposase
MDGKVLGIERRRRWSKDEKSRIVEETLMPGAVVSEVARRHGVAQSLLFTWRRLARTAEPARRDGSILLPVEIGAMAAPSGLEAARPSRPATSGRRTKSGMIEIELGSGSRVRVDNNVDADALRRVLSVLDER